MEKEITKTKRFAKSCSEKKLLERFDKTERRDILCLVVDSSVRLDKVLLQRLCFVLRQLDKKKSKTQNNH